MSGYRSKAVKKSLRSESYEKCIYCESKVPHVAHGHIDHIKPKREFPDLTLEYENLGYSCDVCNNKKGDYFDELVALVNPYIEDPSSYLMAVGSLIFRRPGSDRGYATEKVIALNRPELVERRQERIESVMELADKVANATSAAVRAVALRELEKECGQDREYSFVVSTCVRKALDAV